jgi:hypothetical protein
MATMPPPLLLATRLAAAVRASGACGFPSGSAAASGGLSCAPLGAAFISGKPVKTDDSAAAVTIIAEACPAPKRYSVASLERSLGPGRGSLISGPDGNRSSIFAQTFNPAWFPSNGGSVPGGLVLRIQDPGKKHDAGRGDRAIYYISSSTPICKQKQGQNLAKLSKGAVIY